MWPLRTGLLALLAGYVLAGGCPWANVPWLLGAPLSLSVLPAIILSGLPDRSADAEAGKRTLPMHLGARHAIAIAWLAILAAAVLALVFARPLSTRVAYRGIVWGVVPHAAVLGLALLRLATRRTGCEGIHINGVLVLALLYILWFAVVPLCNLW